jgi:mannosyl-oligosaccharide alpha-1,2-mannosidase
MPRRTAVTIAKLSCAVFIVLFYLLYSSFNSPTPYTQGGLKRPNALSITYTQWNETNTGDTDDEKRGRIQRVMRQTWNGYLERAWTHDEIKPVTGGTRRSRNGWGVFVVDSSSTLALMGMWNELARAVGFILEIDFNNPVGLVDPFETTIRYLGGILSLVDMMDAGVIPTWAVSDQKRAALIAQAETLAKNLLPAYETASGLPWPNVNFKLRRGAPREDPHRVTNDDDDLPITVGPARAGTNILEHCVLSNLTSNPHYCSIATNAWSNLVWSKYIPSLPGLVDGPLDITTGAPTGRSASWDAGHDSYYEYLIKASLLFPSSPHRKTYESRFLAAANAVRWNLTSRSTPTAEHEQTHLFLGRWEGPWFANQQNHLSCFAPGTLLLGSKALSRPDLQPLALSLLEGCHHVYNSTPTGLGPESWSWVPALSDNPRRHGYPGKWVFGSTSEADADPSVPSSDQAQLLHEPRISFYPQTASSVQQAQQLGFYVVDPRFRLRPEYLESLFYAYRITGAQKYRDWAWDAFTAMERWCKTDYGFGGITDVMAGWEAGGEDREEVDIREEVQWLDEQESFWAAETLKYAWMTFSSVNETRLEEWVFSTEGHPFRRRDGTW